MGILQPTWYEPSFQKIDFKALKERGINVILCDLDNTLTAYCAKEPDDNVKDIVAKIKDFGFRLVVISNNNEERVSTFCKDLNIEYFSSVDKPFPYKIRKYMQNNALSPDQCVVIGDQLITDVAFANQLKVRSILVEPAVDSDLPVTRLNRLVDKQIRKNQIKRQKYKKLGD